MKRRTFMTASTVATVLLCVIQAFAMTEANGDTGFGAGGIVQSIDNEEGFLQVMS